MKINKSIIKIVGLLGDFNKKSARLKYNQFINNGYKRELIPEINISKEEAESKRFFKNSFYPEFRDMMYLGQINSEEKRFSNNQLFIIGLDFKSGEILTTYSLKIIKSEIYVFEGHIGLFSVSIEIIPNDNSSNSELNEGSKITVDDASNVTSKLRLFDTVIKYEGRDYAWSQWISEFILCGTELESKDGSIVKADEFSGSKFKLYTVYELDDLPDNNLLFDLGTCSRLGSSAGIYSNAVPHESYYKRIMKKNKISVFQNWEALCLFDTFTCIGNGQILERSYVSWDETYFKIYLYRLFFKYNLYRYNSEIFEDKHSAIKVRDQFVDFLNRYEISHISFNFLPNEIYSKIGEALELEVELEKFKTRINNLSDKIQEERESKTNMLLHIVTVLGGISSVGPILTGVKLFQKQVQQEIGLSTGWFNAISTLLILLVGIGVLYFIVPHELKKVWKKIKSIFR
jgi:hypothetical protein